MLNYLKVIFVCFLFCCLGCTHDDLNRASVSGIVTLNGKPLEKGTIAWLPLHNEGPTIGCDIRNGKYSIPKKSGPAVGEYLVAIKGEPVPTGKKVPSGMNSSVMVDELVDPVPEKYRSGNMSEKHPESTLKVTISSGKNVHDFTLNSDP
ncbi:MAG: hypothetical protein LBI18_06370 [Planctomycetaceae bacterium]|jgi:hypothetical protein|nr:hypothetical protein [Planctomycetaceae bacterium]